MPKRNNTNLMKGLQADTPNPGKLDNPMSLLLQFVFRQFSSTANSPLAAPGIGSFPPNPNGQRTGETMKQEYFVVVLAHSLRGRLRRVHIPHQAVYAILAFALLGFFSFFGLVASYARMVGKVANYNTLKRETDGLRAQYQSLQAVVNQKNDQLA